MASILDFFTISPEAGAARKAKADSYSKSQKQLDAEANYQNVLATKMAENESVASNPTGAANALKVLGGSSFADAGYDSTLKKAWDATQNFAGTDDTYTTGGGYTKAEKSKRKAEAAAKKSIVTEVAEEEEEEAVVADTTPSKLETAKTNMLNMADTTQSTGVATVATEEAKKDKKKGFKGGTIVTSPQGLLAGSGDALRPKRSLLATA